MTSNASSVAFLLRDRGPNRATAVQRVLWGLLTLQAVAGIGQAFWISPSPAEIHRLLGGLRRLDTGIADLDTGNPPLLGNVAAALAIPCGPRVDWSPTSDRFALGSRFVRDNPARLPLLVGLGRLAVCAATLWGTCLIHRLGRAWFGTKGALFAASAWALSPLVAGQGMLLHPDAPAAVALLASTWYAWCWGRDGTLTSALATGGTVGLALSLKYVAIAGLPACLVAAFAARARRVTRTPTLVIGAHSLLAGLCAVSVLHGVEMGRGDWSRVEDWRARASGEVTRPAPPAFCSWAGVPTLLPRSWVRGLVELREAAGLAGQGLQSNRGQTLRYYAHLLLDCTPPGIALLWIAALPALGASRGRRLGAALIVATGLTTCWGACLSAVPYHPRYALPAVAWSCLATAAIPCQCGIWCQRWQRPMILGGGLLTAAGLVWVLPWQWSYQTSWARLRGGGFSTLVDQVDDEGYDLWALIAWERRNPQMRPAYYAVRGLDPRSMGSELSPLGNAFVAMPYAESSPPAGFYVVSGCLLTQAGDRAREAHLQLTSTQTVRALGFLERLSRAARPVGRIGGDLYLFHWPSPTSGPQSTIPDAVGMPVSPTPRHESQR